MRRLSLYALTSVSVAALLAVTSVSMAVPPNVRILGLLQPKEKWNVATVEEGKNTYCAMVGKFDQASTLAFARSPEGFGSLGIEFLDEVFKPGRKYEVTLDIGKLPSRTFSGEATSARALILQIGEDDALYSALGSSQSMQVTTSAVEARFAISAFKKSYASLVNCASALAGPQEPEHLPPAHLTQAEIDAMAKADLAAMAAEGEVLRSDDSVSGTQLALAEAEPAQATKSSPLGGLWQKLKGKPAEPNGAATALAAVSEKDIQWKEMKPAEAVALPLRKPAAAVELAAADVPAAAPVAQVQVDALAAAPAVDVPAKAPERKLLASIATPADAGMSAPEEEAATSAAAGMSAREMERAETAGLTRNMRTKEREIAALSETATASARQQVVDSGRRQENMVAQAEGLKKEISSLEKTVSDHRAQVATVKAADPSAVALAVAAQEHAEALAQKQAELERLNAARVAETSGLAQNLAKTEADFTRKLAALETERDGLKTQLDQALVLNSQAIPAAETAQREGEAKVKTLEAQLATAETARLSLREQLAQAEAANKSLQSSVKSQEEKRIKAEEDVRQLASLRTELEQRVRENKELELALAAEKAKAAAETAQVADASAPAPVAAVASALTSDGTPETAPVQLAAAAPAAELSQPDVKAQDDVPAAGAAPVRAAAAPAPQVAPEPSAKTVIAEVKTSSRAKAATAAAPEGRKQAAPVRTAANSTLFAALAAQTRDAHKLAGIVPAAGADDDTPSALRAGGNSAESFLDSIMQHHRPQGGHKPVAAPVVTPAESAAAAALSAPAARPVPSAAAQAQPVLRNIPPAASTGGAVTLETLLDQAGVRGATFQPMQRTSATEAYRQWTLGRISGLYEQMPAQGKSFDALANAYVGRYRSDCPKNLTVKIGKGEQTPAGVVANGSLSCTMAGNAYETSMIFVQSGAVFAALLHSGNPADAAQVKSIADNISYILSSSAGLSPIMAPAPATAVRHDAAGGVRSGTVPGGYARNAGAVRNTAVDNNIRASGTAASRPATGTQPYVPATTVPVEKVPLAAPRAAAPSYAPAVQSPADEFETVIIE